MKLGSMRHWSALTTMNGCGKLLALSDMDTLERLAQMLFRTGLATSFGGKELLTRKGSYFRNSGEDEQSAKVSSPKFASLVKAHPLQRVGLTDRPGVLKESLRPSRSGKRRALGTPP